MYSGRINRDQLFKLAGITGERAYTPVTVGRRNRTTKPMRLWADQFCNLNFTNAEELRAIQPETVTAQTLYTVRDGEHRAVSNKWKAIVGDTTGDTYAFHSDNYEVVQHSVIIDAMCDASRDTSLSLFGHFDEENGRFNGYGTFANPDVHINLGEEHDDPVMLGMRFYNSHNGDSKFGGEIFGIRYVCGNYMAYGDVLGKVSIKHFKSAENVANSLAGVLKGFVDRMDSLKDRVHYIRDTILTADEQSAVLWGIGFNPKQVESIMTYKALLNPELTGSISAYDIYNAGTAFISYKVSGAGTVNSNLGLSEKVERLLTGKIDRLIDEGERKRTRYAEESEPRNVSRLEVFA